MTNRSALVEKHPWTQQWWKADDRSVLFYILLIHVLAAAGFILFPLPGWKVFLAAVAATALGGFGTTIAYHRALAHRAVRHFLPGLLSAVVIEEITEARHRDVFIQLRLRSLDCGNH